MKSLRQKMIREMTIRNFSPNTQNSYLRAVTSLAKHYMISPEKLTEEQVKDYLFYLVIERRYKWSSCNVAVSGINFLYQVTLNNKAMRFPIPGTRHEKHLPQILSFSEVERLITALDNPKHRALLMTSYASGMRVSEVVNLKITDIESERMMIRVDQGKGKKDRYTILSKRLLQELRSYWTECRPPKWLFHGRDINKPMCRNSASVTYRKAKKKAGITRGQGIHTLRHCFATHLLEMGTDIRTIQLLLGHTCLSTTMIYLQVSSKNLSGVKSPLELLTVPRIEVKESITIRQ